MRLLHGSYLEISKPDLSKCKSHNDFGKGFYLTPKWKKTWQMGRLSSMLHHGSITVNAFLFYPKQVEQNGLIAKKFNGFSQFGNEYIQYCFCTQKAIDLLIKD